MPTHERIALRNPDPARMGATVERAKYDRMRAAGMAALGRGGALTSTGRAEAVEREPGDTPSGSVRWHGSSARLDLEARGRGDVAAAQAAERAGGQR